MSTDTWFQCHPKKTLLLLYLAFLCLVEIVLRLTLGRELLARESDCVVPDSLTHHDYRPGVVFTTYPYRQDTFPPAFNQINSQGIRGPEIGAKTVPRILLVGDSFVQADEVDFEATFASLLNRRFAGRLEFIAHGMASWAPTPEFSWIYHRGLALEPDEIVLFLSNNDFYRAAVFRQGDQEYRRQAVYLGEIPVRYRLERPPFLKTALRRIALLGLFRRSLGLATAWFHSHLAPGELTLPAEILILSQPAVTWPKEVRENVEATANVVLALHRYLQERGIRLHVLLVPLGFAWPDEIRPGKQHPLYGWEADFAVSQEGLETYLRDRFQKASLPWIDLQSAFARQKREDPALLFNEVDGHWNVRGHRLVAEILGDYFAALVNAGQQARNCLSCPQHSLPPTTGASEP